MAGTSVVFAWSEHNEGWETGPGQWAEWEGVSVRGGLRGALQARGKSLGFVLCYGMRSVGSLGSVFHCQRSTLVSLCQPSAGMSWWRPETRSEAVAGAQVTRCDLLGWGGQQRGGGRGHILSEF